MKVATKTTAVGTPPKPAELLAIRQAHDLSQTAAAGIVFSSLRTWQNWESGARRMHPAIWQYFLHAVGVR